MEPQLIERECGGWLAVNLPSDPLKIGVTAPTRDEAEAAFAQATQAWRTLLAKAARRSTAGVEPTES